MTIEERLRRCRLIEMAERYPEDSERLGLTDLSEYRGEPCEKRRSRDEQDFERAFDRAYNAVRSFTA